MTREEAKEIVEAAFDTWESEYSTGDDWSKEHEARDMAIKALEQEPRKGHWIEGQSDSPDIHNILCSRCFEGYPSKGHANSKYTREKFKWCPNCGAYMVGEVEE